MIRWLSIFLVVVLGWLAPAGAGARTTPSRAPAAAWRQVAGAAPVASINYDGENRLARVPAVNGLPSDRTYDALGKPDSIGDAPNPMALSYYDAPGNGVATVAPIRLADQFITMDTTEGDTKDPLGLHKYLYCEANPVNGSDPTGQSMSWDSYFGYEAERTIEDEYEATHAGDGTMYGARQSTGTSFLKPDIFNPTKKKFLEIKPISVSGISKGLLKMGIDEAAFGKFTLGFSPDASWQPRSHLLETDEDGLIYVINVGGLVLYKDVDELKWQLIAVGSIKAASDLLPYLRLSMADLSPLAARIRVLSLGIATEEEADIEDSVLMGGETALMGAP